MRWLTLSIFLFAGCSGPAAPSVQAPVVPAEPGPSTKPDASEPEAGSGVPDNSQTQEQRDYRRVLMMEDKHHLFKRISESEASRGDKEAAAETRERLRKIESEHRELVIKYPQWQRPVLRH